jgi:hypothetical protein
MHGLNTLKNYFSPKNLSRTASTSTNFAYDRNLLKNNQITEEFYFSKSFSQNPTHFQTNFTNEIMNTTKNSTYFEIISSTEIKNFSSKIISNLSDIHYDSTTKILTAIVPILSITYSPFETNFEQSTQMIHESKTSTNQMVYNSNQYKSLFETSTNKNQKYSTSTDAKNFEWFSKINFYNTNLSTSIFSSKFNDEILTTNNNKFTTAINKNLSSIYDDLKKNFNLLNDDKNNNKSYSNTQSLYINKTTYQSNFNLENTQVTTNKILTPFSFKTTAQLSKTSFKSSKASFLTSKIPSSKETGYTGKTSKIISTMDKTDYTQNQNTIFEFDQSTQESFINETISVMEEENLLSTNYPLSTSKVSTNFGRVTLFVSTSNGILSTKTTKQPINFQDPYIYLITGKNLNINLINSI